MGTRLDTANWYLFAYSRFAYSRFAYFSPKSGVSPTFQKNYIWAQNDVKLDLEV